MTVNWNAVQAEIKSNSNIAGPREALLKEVKLSGVADLGSGAVATLSLKSKFSVQMLEKLLMPELKRAFEIQMGKPVSFEFEVESSQESFSFEDLQPEGAGSQGAMSEAQSLTNSLFPQASVQFKERLRLNPLFTLKTLVETQENILAVRSVEQFISTEASLFSVLTFQGPSGVGKTHLLHSAGWRSRAFFPSLRTKVLTADEFITDFQTAISKKNMGDFRRRYRLETDLLLVDDLHSIARAKGTQEEFFNLMNAFGSTGRKIIITSDRPIDQIEGLEERIKSRINGGLVIPVSHPCELSRMVILRSKLIAAHIHLDAEMIALLCRTAGPCIRALDGIIHKVSMLMRLNALNRESIEKMMGGHVTQIQALRPEVILQQVAEKHGLNPADLKSTSRVKNVVEARRDSMIRMRDELKLSASEIGRLHNRDHSTVLAVLKK